MNFQNQSSLRLALMLALISLITLNAPLAHAAGCAGVEFNAASVRALNRILRSSRINSRQRVQRVELIFNLTLLEIKGMQHQTAFNNLSNKWILIFVMGVKDVS